MRRELDHALARLQRWDEVRRQLVNEATGGSDPLVDEVVRAVAAVLHRHGSGTVMVSVTDTGTTSTAEVSYQDGTVTVSAVPDPTAASPRPSHSAAKLAELIRKNPALLDGMRAGGDQPSH